MREITFRGKRLDNGEWVQGFLSNWYDYQITEKEDDVTAYPIDIKTVGQYTGLTDKNGKKIFEGDIVNYPDTYFSWTGDVDVKGNIGAVEWDKDVMCFYFSNRNSIDMDEFEIENGCMTEVEVIGNIHDNPELIGGGDNDK